MLVPPGTPFRGRAGSFSDLVNGGKRKHEENVSIAVTGVQHGVGDQTGQAGAGGGGPGVGGGSQPPRVPRKQCFGASKVVATAGKADWAAPVEVFISNTSPDVTEEEIKEILKLCADDAKTVAGNEILEDFAVKNVKCLTRPEFENPRTKCWRVSVPFRFKEYIMSDVAYPMGWSHRPFYPPRQKPKEGSDAEQLAKRNRTAAM